VRASRASVVVDRIFGPFITPSLLMYNRAPAPTFAHPPRRDIYRYLIMYNAMYPARPRHSPTDHPHPQHRTGPAGPADVRRRQAPEVDLVLLPDSPHPDRSLDLLVWGVLGASLVSAVAMRDPFLLVLARTLLVGLVAAHVLVAAARWRAAKPAGAISRAIRAVEDGEHPRRVLDGLRVMQLAGRPRLRLGIAVRCLEASGRSRRLEWALRRQAIIWLIEARNEISREEGA